MYLPRLHFLGAAAIPHPSRCPCGCDVFIFLPSRLSKLHLLPPPSPPPIQLSKSRLWLQTTLLGAKFSEEDVFKPEEEVHEVRRCKRGQEGGTCLQARDAGPEARHGLSGPG